MTLGVTGSIGAGKSTVARFFAECGAVVVSADALARELVAPGTPLLAELVRRFGAAVLDAAGELDRPRMAQRIFADAAARKALERLLHPAIAALAAQRLAAARDAGAPLVIYEAPLLFEAGAERQVDRVLVVTVAAEEQLRRLCDRDGLEPEEARRRIAAQWSQADKAARADYVIDNSGPAAQTRSAVATLFNRLTAAPAGEETSGTT